ncbi:flagellar biosynthesis regulator FlhF [compost metagenome]
MDETDTYGSIINLVNDFQLQMSYVTHGQSVPEDITELNEQQIIDQIVGVIQDE